MSKDFEEFERACVKIKEDNAKLLADFGQWLEQKGLAKKTITEHVKNADFYINTFLLYDEAIPARDGASPSLHVSRLLVHSQGVVGQSDLDQGKRGHLEEVLHVYAGEGPDRR